MLKTERCFLYEQFPSLITHGERTQILLVLLDENVNFLTTFGFLINPFEKKLSPLRLLLSTY